MSEQCYIYWDDDSVPEHERRIYMQCVECFKKNRKGYPWSAFMGYGAAKIVCQCGYVIHQGEDEE